MPVSQGDHIVPTHKAGYEFRLRRVENIAGRAGLLDHRVVHNNHFIGKRQRLVLTMGNMDKADLKFPLQLLQLGPHPNSQERGESRERLIHQQGLGFGNQCTGQGHPLLLPAGQLIRHGTLIREQFPDTPESRQKVSEATDLVWVEKARFDGLAEEFVALAEALEAAIALDDAEAIRVVFGKTGKSCSACHEDFREKDD